jgi:FkbM family methyltransferase
MKKSYSFEGQDMIALSILRNVNKKGLYIDVGSGHPIKENDTYALYKMNWRGILVEPLLTYNSLYKKHRPKDFIFNNLIGRGGDSDVKNFYIFSKKFLSTSDTYYWRKYKKKEKLLKVKKIKSLSLNDLLNTFKKKSLNIDFLKIDTEGNEFEVLKNLNLNVYRPKLIQVEIKDFNLNLCRKNKIFKYLIKNNYSFVCKTLLDSFFLDKKSKYFNFLPKRIL